MMPKLTKEQFNKFENIGSITIGDTIIISDQIDSILLNFGIDQILKEIEDAL